MRDPDEAFAYGLGKQIESYDFEIERVRQHLMYLRGAKQAAVEKLREVQARTGGAR